MKVPSQDREHVETITTDAARGAGPSTLLLAVLALLIPNAWTVVYWSVVRELLGEQPPDLAVLAVGCGLGAALLLRLRASRVAKATTVLFFVPIMTIVQFVVAFLCECATGNCL